MYTVLGQQPLPYQANFEEEQGYLAGNVHGQNGWQVDQGRAEVTAAAGRQGSEGLVIAATNPFGQVSVIFQNDMAFEVAFSDFWIKPAVAEPVGNEEFLDQEGAIAGFFRIDEEGEFYVLNGDGQEGGEWISTGIRVLVEGGEAATWTRITIRQDFREVGKIWDIFVNGQLRAANLGFWSDGSEWLQRFTFMGHTQFPLHLDDITVGDQNPLFKDADRDGIADELQDFAQSGRDDDPDGDGFTNIEEILLGSDPTVADRSELDEIELESPEALTIGLTNIYALPIPFAADGAGTPLQQTQLASSLMAYRQRNDVEQTEDLEAYVSNAPASPYSLWVEANIARRAYNSGRYSKALSIYERLWSQYQPRPETNSPFYRLVNTVGVDLARLYARLGRKDALGVILEKFETRTVRGHDSERLYHAMLGYGLMETKPGKSFNCGIFAIRNVAGKDSLSREALDVLAAQDASSMGFSLASLGKIAKEIGEDLVMVRRSANDDIIVPSVVHWRSDHYAAITEQMESEGYRVVDPTFGRNFWMSEAALLEESSGYYLVPSNQVKEGWELVDTSEGNSVWGRGVPTGQTELDDPCDEECGSTSQGMATYGLNHFRASLTVRDTPLFYDTPYGPSMDFTATYNQSSLSPLSGLNYSNMGDKWFCNWISFVQPVSGSSNKELFLPDGRKESHIWDSSASEYALHQMSQSRLVSVTGGFERRSNDGFVMSFTKSGKESSPDTRYFLTSMTDPYGNSVTFTYDGITRLTKVTDVFGNEVTFSYTDGSNGYLITEIKDSRSTTRKAQFLYDSSDRLQKITDVEGIESSFTYSSSSDRLASMSTPYGTTTFILNNNIFGRYSIVTDPEGLKEKVQYYNDAGTLTSGLPGVTSSGDTVSSEYSQLTSDGHTDISYLDVNEGITLYHDKKAWKDGGNSFLASKAHQTHWRRSEATLLETQGIPSSTRTALTNRVFYIYPQTHGSERNTDQPSHVCQVVKDYTGSTVSKVHEYEYHAESGRLTKSRDPSGRETKLSYDSTGVDLLSVQAKESSSTYKTLRTYGSYSNHKPGSVTDAGGNTTTITYNGKKQLKLLTNPLGDKVRFTYDRDPNSGTVNNDDGYLIKIERTDPANTSSYVTLLEITDYDDYDRPITVENADGYELDYVYDKLNRVTLITHPETTPTTEQYLYTSGIGTKFPDLQRMYDREGKLTTFVQNGNRQLIEIHDPEHTYPTEFEWCACGDLEWVTDPDLNKTTWHRDLLGRVTSKVYTDAEQFSYTYEAESGLLSTITYPNDSSATVTLKYYKDGNLRHKDHSNANTVDATYYYDFYHDRLTQRTDTGNGYSYTFTYSYHSIDGVTDGAGELSVINGPFSYDSILYSYDGLGRVKKRVIDTYDTAQEHTVEWVFDELDRVQDLVTGLGTFSHTYVGDSSLLDAIDYPNGQIVDYMYHPHSAGRFLQEIRNYKVGSPSSYPYLSRFTYTYTESGQINRWFQQMPTNSGATSYSYNNFDYTYDDVYQLDTVIRKNLFLTPQQTWNFDYDAAGNRFKRSVTDHTPDPDTVATDTYTSNSRNQTTYITGASGTFTLTHDDNGNLLSKTRSGGGKTNYEWDAVGNLVAVEVLAGTSPATGDTRTEIRYNSMNQRMEMFEKKRSGGSWVSDTALVGLEHLYFVWADGELCQRRTSTSSSTTKTNFYTMGESRHVGTGSSNKSDYFYTRDHLGSVYELVDSSGNIDAAYRYSPYGIREKQPLSTMDCEIGFTGHHYHERTGLHLTWFRAYDADLGRWLSPDPVGEDDGLNLYGYVGNKPINNLDLLGLFDISCLGEEFKTPQTGGDFDHVHVGPDGQDLGPHMHGSKGSKLFPNSGYIMERGKDPRPLSNREIKDVRKALTNAMRQGRGPSIARGGIALALAALIANEFSGENERTCLRLKDAIRRYRDGASDAAADIGLELNNLGIPSSVASMVVLELQ